MNLLYLCHRSMFTSKLGKFNPFRLVNILQIILSPTFRNPFIFRIFVYFSSHFFLRTKLRYPQSQCIRSQCIKRPLSELYRLWLRPAKLGHFFKFALLMQLRSIQIWTFHHFSKSLHLIFPMQLFFQSCYFMKPSHDGLRLHKFKLHHFCVVFPLILALQSSSPRVYYFALFALLSPLQSVKRFRFQNKLLSFSLHHVLFEAVF